MATLAKAFVIDKANALRGAIIALKSSSTESAEFVKWNHDVKALLRNAFGAESAHLKAFEQISFWSMVVSLDADNSGWHREAYVDGMQSADGLLAAIAGEVADYWPNEPVSSSGPAAVAAVSAVKLHPADVFVVHGRNTLARDGLFSFLRSIRLNPLEWSQAIVRTGRPSPYIGEILDAAFTSAQAVVVLFTPDELAHLRPEFRFENDPPHDIKLTGQSRPNVLFEAGMAVGRCPTRTVMVQIGESRPFSDIAGVHVHRLSNDSVARQGLAQRLALAGCSVDLSGTSWHSSGDLSPKLADAVQPGTVNHIVTSRTA
ncbi:MAG: TIR domain-containing protein [Phycisphaerales bacterium]